MIRARTWAWGSIQFWTWHRYVTPVRGFPREYPGQTRPRLENSYEVPAPDDASLMGEVLRRGLIEGA